MDYTLTKQARVSPRVAAAAPKEKGAIAPKEAPKAPPKFVGKIYTDEEIRDATAEGYIMVFPGLWDHIPAGAHIKFLKKDKGAGKPRGERFKPGGFVRNHFELNGKQMIMVETKPGGSRNDKGYISFPLAYEDLEIIWKKYDKDAFIEIHLIYNSLAQKKQQIEELIARVDKLENILRNSIR